MRKNRSLALKRETLSELTTTEMAGFAGGSHACVTEGCTNPVTHGTTFDVCPTLPINDCLSPLIAHTFPACTA